MFHSYVSLPEGKVPDPVTDPRCPNNPTFRILSLVAVDHFVLDLPQVTWSGSPNA